ncbi:MAG: DUF3572 domain-containing protein [Rhizobiales bacterium]|nr:DUF3572 domain-containing protein [Hyphomicrobiales bacterium]
MVKPRPAGQRKNAEALAIQALTFIAADAERLGRFLAITGIGPDQIRTAAAEPNFLAGVLDHIAGDEKLLMAFANEAGIDPVNVARAREALGDATWERDAP